MRHGDNEPHGAHSTLKNEMSKTNARRVLKERILAPFFAAQLCRLEMPPISNWGTFFILDAIVSSVIALEFSLLVDDKAHKQQAWKKSKEDFRLKQHRFGRLGM